MIIIGELINASRKKVAEAIQTQDVEAIQSLAVSQAERGADFIDVNAGVFGDKEKASLKWLVQVVQDCVDKPCCIDSPNPHAIEDALAGHKGVPMINSISLEQRRYEDMLSLLKGGECKIIALCTSDSGAPKLAEERVETARELVEKLVHNKFSPQNIYVDPMVQAISTSSDHGASFLASVRKIKASLGVNTVCGLSNISFGLPERKHINRTFMAMAIAMGLDAAIVDPLDKKMMATIITAGTLAGNDNYCRQFLQAYREGLIGEANAGRN
jgi:5-methyltetrahydrofolate--homocysteine methyltransferase